MTLFGSSVTAAALDTNSASNGLTAIFSTSFAGGLPLCGPSSPSYCSFFGGLPSAGQIAAVSISPNPTGLTTNTPAAILGAGAGSFLNLTSDGITSTLAGGTVTFGNGSITIVPAATTIGVTNAGMVFDAAAQVAAVNPNGTSEFLVNLSPALAVDFSTLAGGAVTSCAGPACAALGTLSLDMVRYRLFVEWDPTFTNFNSTFIGQTGNNAMVYANLNTIPVPAAVWLMGSALGLLGLARRKVAA
ncbi:MAG: hypothetical protein JNK40_14635 [Chromatiales bacterium]|nr:hypothetical protein [Chromatiales bacterium]